MAIVPQPGELTTQPTPPALARWASFAQRKKRSMKSTISFAAQFKRTRIRDDARPGEAHCGPLERAPAVPVGQYMSF